MSSNGKRSRRRREVVDIEFALRVARKGESLAVAVSFDPPPVALSVHAAQRCQEMGIDPERVRVLVASGRQTRYRREEWPGGRDRVVVSSPDVPDVCAVVEFGREATIVVTVLWPHEFVR